MAFKVSDMRTPTNLLQVSAEAHTFAVGAAGTVVIFRIDKRPILNELGTGLGIVGDTSFEWVTGTIFTTEVAFDKRNVGDLTSIAGDLSNGEYAIDYLNGIFIGKKATTDTSDSCNYLTEQINTEVTVSATIGDLNYTKIKNVAVSTGVGDVDTGTQRLTFATDDINLAAINTATTSLEAKDFATETTLGTVKTNLESIETDIEATNTALGTIETDIEATNTLLGDGNQKTQIVDGLGNVIGSTSNALDVNIKSGITLEVNLDNADDDVLVYGWDGAANQKILTHTDGSLKVYSIDQDVNVVTNLDAFDFATETTLSNIDTNLTDVIDTSAHIVRVVEQDPVIYHFTPEVIASVTNGTDGTYNYYINKDTFRKHGLQVSADGGSGTVTVTIEATMQDDGTAPASCVYEGVTNSAFNAASFVTTTADIYSLIDDAEVLSLYKYVKVKVVADTTGANDADWTIRSKQVY